MNMPGKFQNPAIPLDNSSVTINSKLGSPNEIAGFLNLLGLLRSTRIDVHRVHVHSTDINRFPIVPFFSSVIGTKARLG